MKLAKQIQYMIGAAKRTLHRINKLQAVYNSTLRHVVSSEDYKRMLEYNEQMKDQDDNNTSTTL